MNPWNYEPFHAALERAENWIAVRHATEQQVDPELSQSVLDRLHSVCYVTVRSMNN